MNKVIQAIARPTKLLSGKLAPGSVIQAGTSVSETVQIVGVSILRVRALITGADGTLTVELLNDIDAQNPLSFPPARSVAVNNGVESVLELDNILGERYVRIRISVPSGPANATVSYVYIGYGESVAAPERLFRVSDEFNRPNNTTAYSALHRIAESTSDTATVPLRSLAVGASAGGKGIIRFIALSTSNANFTPNVRLHFYTSPQPPTAIAGDGSTMAMFYNNRQVYLGSVTMPTLQSLGGTGSTIAIVERDDVLLPFVCASNDDKIYYAIQILSAATPAANQSFRLVVSGLQL